MCCLPVFFFCFVLSKAQLPYISISYLPQHLQAVKINAFSLCNLTHNYHTVQQFSALLQVRLPWENSGHSALHETQLHHYPLPKGCCYFLPSLPWLPHAPASSLLLCGSSEPSSHRECAEGGPCGVIPCSTGLMGSLPAIKCSCLPDWKHPVQQQSSFPPVHI